VGVGMGTPLRSDVCLCNCTSDYIWVLSKHGGVGYPGSGVAQADGDAGKERSSLQPCAPAPG
jgi:hypothetical protein